MYSSINDLLSAIRLGEDTTLELKDIRYKGDKVGFPNRNAIADEFAAMANSTSGVFVFGVDDKTRMVTGIPDDKLDLVEEWIRNICNDLVELMDPKYLEVRGMFYPRGGIAIYPFANWAHPDFGYAGIAQERLFAQLADLDRGDGAR